MIRRIIVLLWLCLIGSGQVIAATDPVKLMSYNLLNYPDANSGSITTDTSLRNPFYRTIVAAANPDILVVQELLSLRGDTNFLNFVMNKALSGFATGTFIDGFDTDNGIFYRTSKFIFISNTAIKTALRDINEFKLKHILSGDTLRIYSVHLKASSTPSDEAQRAAEVDSLRKITNALPLGANFVVCGDFNIYNNTESAYVKLKQVIVGNEGHFIDPLNITGSWNQIAYAPYHTQSPRIRAFGGGSTGGMDDRFDMILYSKALSIAGGVDFSAGSLVAYGNDGNHYNDSINDPPNTAVGQTIADALHNAADHIPVIATINFNYTSTATNDFGVQLLLSPLANNCPSSAQTLQVQVKNYGSTTIDFSSVNLPVELKVTNPSAGILTFNKTINSGTIAPGNTINVTFDLTLNMTSPGSYSFKSYTQVSQDINHANDTNVTAVNVSTGTQVTVSPAGPVAICNSNPVVLTSSVASFYSWNTGATTTSISVSVSGNYFVSVTYANGCTSTSNTVTVTVDSFRVSGILYAENFGVPTSNTFVNSYTGWQNGAPVNYLSTTPNQSDVRVSNPSSGYSTASGSGNVFMGTSTSGPRNLIISGINTAGYQNLSLSFGLRKENSGSDPITVEVSSDDSIYSPLTITQPASFSTWYYVTASGNIPATTNLRIRFSKQSIVTQFRIDDLRLSYNNGTPAISAAGPTTFCNGGSVMLNASSATTYLWSNSSTVQSINVAASGNYFVTLTSANGCTALSNTIAVTVNPNLTASVSITVNPASPVCNGTPVTFTATPTNGGTAPAYNFKINNISKQNGADLTYTPVLLANNDIVKCEMTGNKVCTTPAIATSNSLQMVVTPQPTWYLDYDQDGYFKNGFTVTQCSSPGSGYTTSVTAGGDCNDSNFVVHPGLTEVCNNGLDDDCNGQVDEGCNITLNLKVYVEGLYLSNGMMSIGDTIQVELHNSNPPYSLFDSAIGFVSPNGEGDFSFASMVLNTSKFIVVRHRNAIQTWSKNPVFFNNAVMFFDFSAP